MEIVKAFENNDMQMHITIQGTREEPLFRASDIGVVLELTNIRQTIKDFDQTEKCGVIITDIIGRDQETTFLTEKGLYQVLFTSRKPIAKKFKDWVCEVIQEIRLSGRYELEKQLELKNEEIILTKETTLIDAYRQKPVLYLAHAEKNIIKFGYSDDIETRVREHKREIGPQFTILHIIETVYNRKLETMIKQELKKYIIKKTYPGREKPQTELIRLNSKFTIKTLYKKVLGFKDECHDNVVTELQEENAKVKNRNTSKKS